MVSKRRHRRTFIMSCVICTDGSVTIQKEVLAGVTPDVLAQMASCPESFNLRGTNLLVPCVEEIFLDDFDYLFMPCGLEAIGAYSISEHSIQGLLAAVEKSDWQVANYGFFNNPKTTVLIP